MNTQDISKFKQLFINEASTLLNSMEGIILNLEKNPNDDGLIQEVFRVMHTIKGVSGMYGFDAMSELTHSVESIYDLIRNGFIIVNKEILDLTLEAVDHLFALIKDKDIENAENASTHKDILSRSEQLLSKSKKTGHNVPVKQVRDGRTIRTYNIILHTPQNIVDRRINVFYAIKDLSEIGEIKSINSLPTIGNDDERWSIFIVGEIDNEAVEEALMFVYEYCIIRKVADFDIFDTNQMDLSKKELLEEAIEASSEINDTPLVDKSTKTPSKTNQSQAAIESIHQNMSRVSVGSEKLDHLMYLVSELITTSSQLNLMTSTKTFDSIRSQMEKLDKLSKNFRNNALEIRLIPIRDMVPKFNRLIRDISNELGKDIDFVTEGMETELDKSSINLIAEPLVHMLRNALDHGIELPEERLEKGKHAKGTIELKAYNSGNHIYIEVSDDGKGIDKDKIVAKAIEKGLISNSDKLSDKDIYQLICHPGFSMAKELTSISGRGVGMDIVLQKILEMRGEMEIKSQLNKGTSFVLKLQQSISIMDTLLVRSSSMKCLLPLSDVEVCSQMAYSEIQNRIKHGTISYEQNLIPFVSLRHLFKLNSDIPNNAKLVIINKNNERIAIATDEIVGQHQAVLKPMGELVKDHDEFSAASVLGNGEIAFLLDPNSLTKSIASC